MKNQNALFKADPVKYLKQNAIECYNIKVAALKTDLEFAGTNHNLPMCDVHLAFDLVPQPGYVSLKIIGSRAKFVKSDEGPIFGQWIPYLGQKSYREPYKFGRIQLDTVIEDYVFTVGFNGCKLVAVQDTKGLMVYHEPTAEAWGFRHPDYGGRVVKEASPKYSAKVAGGFGVITRLGGNKNWKVIVQSCQGARVTDVDVVDLI